MTLKKMALNSSFENTDQVLLFVSGNLLPYLAFDDHYLFALLQLVVMQSKAWLLLQLNLEKKNLLVGIVPLFLLNSFYNLLT